MTKPLIQVQTGIRTRALLLQLWTAFGDGACRKWARVHLTLSEPPGERVEMSETDENELGFVNNVFRYALGEGGFILIEDKHTGQRFKLDRELLTRGLSQLAEERPELLGNILREHVSYASADVMVQFSLFGKVLYG